MKTKSKTKEHRKCRSQPGSVLFMNLKRVDTSGLGNSDKCHNSTM